MNVQNKIPDRLLLGLALILSLLGLFFSFDAGYGRSIGSGHGVIPHEFVSQLEGLIVGLGLAAWVLFFDPKKVEKYARPIWFACVFILIATAVSPLKVVRSGAARWIHIGPILIQGAEFAKVGAILYMAYWLVRYKPLKWIKLKKGDFFEWMDKVFVPRFLKLWPILFILITALLIEKEPDLGTAAVIVAVGLLMSFLAGVDGKTLFTIVVILGLGAVIMVKSQPYRMERVLDHGSQWNSQSIDGPGFQQLQAKVSMAYGGLTGNGVGTGRAKLVIPAPTTDFVLATVAEETGFLGTLLIYVLLAVLVARLVQLAKSSPSKFSSLFLFGVASWIAIQGIVNALQANDTLPSIGIPFPFISSGGSSLAALWLAIGLCEACLRELPEPLPKEAVVDDRIHRRGDRGAYIPSH